MIWPIIFSLQSSVKQDKHQLQYVRKTFFSIDQISTVLSFRCQKHPSFTASVRSSFSKSQLKVYVPAIHQQRCCTEHWLCLVRYIYSTVSTVLKDWRWTLDLHLFSHYIGLYSNKCHWTIYRPGKLNEYWVCQQCLFNTRIKESVVYISKLSMCSGFCVF